MKKIITLVLAAMMLLSLAACGTNGGDAASSDGAYTVGIVQLVQHDALDKATQGFQDALIKELGEENVTFDLQNASGDSANCATIVNGFVADGVDLIMANATPALLAAVNATTTIPVLGTSVTDYGDAMGIEDFDGVVGGNVSGTSDQPPLDEQAAMVTELCPDAKTVAILYCSAEPNSVFQATAVRGYLEEAGLTVIDKTFADSNDVVSVTTSACEEADVIYIPTDNTAASCADAIGKVVLEQKVPVIAGEEGIMAACGIATLSIDYYNLGYATGVMAAKILTGEADISEMAIEYDPNPVKKYNPEICEQLGIEAPEGYVAYEG
ncbi:MAG: ABC transporter substrate-binding protein [Ruminococcus sp.]|nr:ABC transporter substrate-binding protein [Ruminococcus sp.]